MPYVIHQKAAALSRLIDTIRESVYTPVADLDVTAWVTPEPVPYADRTTGRQLELRPGGKWGDLFDAAWFHFTGRVPESAAGRDVVLLIDLNGEACVVDERGNPVRGLTNVNSEYDYSLGLPGKRVVPFAAPAAGGEAVDLWADAGCNDLFGKLRENGTLKEARIAVRHRELHALSYDCEVLNELMRQLPEGSARRARIWTALNDAAAALDALTDEQAACARAILAPELAKRGGDPSLTISAIGHAHIDLAWLWPLRETIRKGARTFSTALRNLEDYPDYVFGASQPQLYQWMKDRYPSLYAEVKQRVAEGRWEVQGAMWVEADANVPGGEALARQLLYGKRFFRQEFGVDVRSLWLPDVFGYSGSLPQLMRLADVDYFMTQKLSWSEVNEYPHHTFHWRGIDGSTVLAHLPPEDTYNSSAAPRAIAKAERDYHDAAVSDACLLLFGIGDGGGGPGEEHLERLARERDLNGLAPVVQEPSARLFERLAADASRYAEWSGELYLEKHQGTFTTQARSKRFNRRMEIALHEAELAACMAHRLAGMEYPQAALEAIWKEALLYQFHDILPGSSITRVYAESLERYAVLLSETERLRDAAEAALSGAIDTSAAARPGIVWNSLSWERAEYVRADDGWRRVWAPSMGYAVVDLAEPGASYEAPTAARDRLENDLLLVTFSSDGSVARVLDKEAGREALTPGEAGNRLAVYDDPGDAWDFPLHYDERPPDHFALKAATARVDGPRAVLRQEYVFGASTLTQEIVLTAGSRRIDFVTEVDWRESGKMLRTSFPANVVASEATCEIQFGNIRRPNHSNTSWAKAQFEVCAHKWVDLSQRDYGVALLNDCKYGHKLKGNVLDLNLLRSPKWPDPSADRAVHHFTYSLLPHTGDYAEGGVVREAYQLNVPLRLTTAEPHGGAQPRVGSFVRVAAENVIVEAVKKAEDGEGVVLRLYEAHGGSAATEVDLGFPAGAATKVNLLEERPAPADLSDVRLAPFQIATLKVE